MEYAANLSVEPFEKLLERAGESPAPPKTAQALSEVEQADPQTTWAPRLPSPLAGASARSLSPERRQLLAIRLRKRAPASAWFPGADAARGTRLFCLPYAGGGAGAFAGWQQRLPGVCPVRLPGRESRSAEASFDRMAPLVEALAAAIAQYLDRPFAFFGHSMGAAVAFELARQLRRLGLPQPCLLIASAARAPQFRRDYVPPPPPSQPEFLAELRRLEGLPSAALENQALLAAILPALTADAALYRNYVYAEDPPLGCAIRAYGGSDDPNVRPVHLEGWASQTGASFAMRLFTGGHFFLHAGQEAVFDALARDLEQAC
jgi:surfactin synthase thioesterase subunit